MTPGKRLLDLTLAVVLLLVLALPLGVIALWILAVDGGPIFYPSERMKTPTKPFTLWKFRTMSPDNSDGGVSAGYKRSRITRTGQYLRAKRLDELPQLFNILKGDMSFVGPRPPLRRYVKMRPDLYDRVLQNRPGVTGLATLVFHNKEERLLNQCSNPEETDHTYLKRCVPTKARLDLLWSRNRNICYDISLIWETIRRVFARRRLK